MEDHKTFIDLMLSTSRRAKLGRPTKIQATKFILQNYHGWEQSRIDRTLTALVQSGQLIRSDKGTFVIRDRACDRELRRIAATKKLIPCAYCGRKLKSGERTKDHVIPKSRGGSDDPSNIVIACHRCNTWKGARTPSEWALSIARFDKPKRVRRPSWIRQQYRRVIVQLALVFVAIKGGLFNA